MPKPHHARNKKSSGRDATMKRLSVRRLTGLLFAGAAMTALATVPARADVTVHIDKSAQRMAVSIDGAPRYNWPVSTGRSGYGTPSGVFRPQMMAQRWFSRKYYNSPMPHSIFFYHGFAIHGTTDLARLGGPASHGCVRLHPEHAAVLFSLIERDGRNSTRIVIN
jgi:lipoprotein-anchoring transpeptidase ErfK/SrfK